MKKPHLSEMTLREKIGQCLCVSQYDLNQKTEINEILGRTEEERDIILRKNPYGAIWCIGNQKLKNANLTEKNYDNIKIPSTDYCDWVKSISKNVVVPLLRATDVESGAGTMFEDLTCVCSGFSIGAADSEKLAFELGAAIARELLCAGINWRWAPVVDMPSRFNMIFMRSFSAELEQLSKLSIAHIKGMQSEGVAATAKHFPGSDPYEYRDPHFSHSEISISMEEWWEKQGKVFQEVINAGVYAVMIQHAAFKAADDTTINGKIVPATLSKKIITDLLKGEMGFEGVVITDALNMGGVQSYYNSEELLIELLKAGNDMLLYVPLNAIDIIEKAVQEQRLSETRIDDACNRVLAMKEKMGLFDDGYSIGAYTSKEVIGKTEEINRQIAEKSITLIRDTNHVLPFDKNKVKKVTLICSTHDETFFTQLQVMKQEFEHFGAEVNLQRRLESQEELQKIAAEFDLILYVAYIAPHRPKGALSFYDEECETFLFAFSVGN